MLLLGIYRWHSDILSGLVGGEHEDGAKEAANDILVCSRRGWRDLNYKFNLLPHLKLFSENCRAIKRPKRSIPAWSKDQKSIMIINHFNLIILYDAPQSPILSRTTQFTPSEHILWGYYHDFKRSENWWAFNQITTVHINIFSKLGINGHRWLKVNSNKAFSPFRPYHLLIFTFWKLTEKQFLSFTHETIKNYYFGVAQKTIN